jgi:AraC family transcriptional regulator
VVTGFSSRQTRSVCAQIALNNRRERPQGFMTAGLFGDRLGDLFPLMEGRRPVAVKSLNGSSLAATRVSHDGLMVERTAPSPADDAFAFCLRLKHQTADVWQNGRHSVKGPIEGETVMYDLQKEIMVHFRDPFDFLYLHIPRRALVDMAYQEDAAGANYSAAASGSLTDPVVAHLGACLLPALDNLHQTNDLFIGYVTMALQTHILTNYIGTSRPLRRHRSGLTARQLRIAKQAISENLDGGMPLDAIARECGLSQSHFTRAFVNSVGQPPHQWLLERRVDLARHLLSESVLPLADIAIQCGFADQSHFTRVFSARTGLSPGRWRRLRRL